MGDRLLDDLDDVQRAAVTSEHVPLAILAPAGSGKTRVLTRRIAYRIREGAARASHVLALTFTRKAAGELVRRLADLDIERPHGAGTFHGVALAQLRRYAGERGHAPPPHHDRKGRILAPMLGGRGPAATIAINEVAGEIEWAKARLITPENYARAAATARRRTARGFEEIAELYERYEREKRSRRVLDFDDVLRRCAELIERDTDWAAAQRWLFQHVFVDEFQDTNPLQLRLLRAWLGDRADLTVVGDPAQAIYGYAGANAAPLVAFASVFPGGHTIALARNYRSTPAIVAVAEAALGDERPSVRATPVAARTTGSAPTFIAYDSEEAEARAVADRCWHLFTGGTPWHDMAVLFRTNAQSIHFEKAFARRNVPFRTVAGGQRFADRPAVRMLIERMYECETPGRTFSEVLGDLAADEFGTDDTGDTENVPEVTESPEVLEHRRELLALGREFVRVDGGASGVAGFVAWLDTAAQPERDDGVALVTFHRAKGLEWPVVFVTGLEQRLVPIAWAVTPDQHAEERRLLHVALSRAGDEVHCSWARSRASASRSPARAPSPWLPELERVAQSFRSGEVDLTTHVAEMRNVLAAATPPAPRVRPARRRTH